MREAEIFQSKLSRIKGHKRETKESKLGQSGVTAPLNLRKQKGRVAFQPKRQKQQAV